MSILDKANLVITPTAYKEDKVYSIVPKDGSGDLTWTRATDATRINKDGYVERTPYNLTTYSEDFTNANWINNAYTTPNAIASPIGNLTADKYKQRPAVDGSVYQSTFQTIFVKGGITTTRSIYVKAAEMSWVYLQQYDGVTNSGVYFNISNGTLGTINGANISNPFIQNVANGWYRIGFSSLSVLAATSERVQLALVLSDGGIPIYTGDGTSGVYIWGAQLMEGSVPVNYFPVTDRLDVPNIIYPTTGGTPSILLEPQRTNSISNSQMLGVVAGSPGTAPTGWSVASTGGYSGLTREILGVGSENGINYMDIRYSGNNSTGSVIYPTITFNTTTIGNTGETWTNSVYVKVISGATPGVVTPLINIAEYTSGGTWIASSAYSFYNTNLERLSISRTLNQSTLNYVRGYINIGINNNTNYDITLRIGCPQMELGSYSTSYIPTTTATVTRNTDTFARSNVYTNGLITASGGSWYIDLENNLSLTRDLASYGIVLGTESNGTGGNSFYILNPSSGPARLHIYKRVNTTATLLYETTTNHIKILIKWNGTAADVFLNGTKIITSTSFTSTALEYLSGSGSDIPKYIKALALFPAPITDAEAIQLTTL